MREHAHGDEQHVARAFETRPTTSARAVALASRTPGGGWGGVWPATVLIGSGCSAALAVGAWLGALATRAPRPWSLGEWEAEHALLGAAAGALVALVLRVLSIARPDLREPRIRRRVGARAVSLAVVFGYALLLATESSELRDAIGPLLGLAAGVCAWVVVLRVWLHAPVRTLDPPRLDATRASVVVALLILPTAGVPAFPSEPAHPPSPSTSRSSLADTQRSRPTSLPTAWQVMLGG